MQSSDYAKAGAMRNGQWTRRDLLRSGSLAACAWQLPRPAAAWQATDANAATAGAATPVRLKTPNGVLLGEAKAGVRVFRGVAFAKPPIGPLRFLPSAKVEPWSGEREATHFPAAPMQVGQHDVTHSEDCLYLNIWTPEGVTETAGLPVFVWIHGGGFTGGHAFEAMYDGSGFARSGIICITVAYRLGVFGFLDFEPLLGDAYAGTANNALGDLVLALEWVKENAAAFGGDSARVTVGGQSAGAKLTDILMGVPSAEGLFHQMISESGGAERVWPRLNSTAVAKGFGEEWTKTGGNTLSTLKSADGALLIDAQERLITSWPQHFPLRAEIDGRLLPKLPVETIAAGSTRNKRLLIGTNRQESAFFVGPHPEHDARAADLGNMGTAKFEEVYRRYADVYPQLSVEERRVRAVTAEEYWIPSTRVAEAHVRGGGTAYVYEVEFAETSGRLEGEAYHSIEVPMVWAHPREMVANATAEAALSQQMHAAWAAFIRGEAPAANGLPPWPLYKEKQRATMIFGTADGVGASRVENDVQAKELRLWDGVL